jgi:aryl-alcohol dehydrogenase-like predicted oxidoreductase
MIEHAPFGSTGHESSRVLFGAAALAMMSQERADRTLEMVLEAGINHIDCAPRYGEAELRLAPWLGRHRDGFFVATKTGDRTRDAARDSVHRSLERMGVDRIDLVQLHNLVPEDEWERALGDGGALEALVDAREQGLVRFIGVTGHGASAAHMHLRSLERFPFDSVLTPCNHSMLSQPEYAADFEKLVALCDERGVAVQTIKAIARRRWQGEGSRRFSWYEPLRDEEAVTRAVHFVLSRPGLFLNTTSDATLLPVVLAAAAKPPVPPALAALDGDVARYEIESLFPPGVDAI